MPVSITVAPSPKRQKDLGIGETHYLVALATLIAEEHSQAAVTVRYGRYRDDSMVIRKTDDDVELF